MGEEGFADECLTDGGFDEEDSSGWVDPFFVLEDGVWLMRSFGTYWMEYFILSPPVRLLLPPVLVAPSFSERMAFDTATYPDIPVIRKRWFATATTSLTLRRRPISWIFFTETKKSN